MVHRATPRLSEEAKWRPMFKFSFTRLHEPSGPSWRHDPATAESAGAEWPGLAAAEAAPICESLWRWHLGETGVAEAEEEDSEEVARLGALVTALPCDGDEAERVGAAYTLGACGSEAAIAVLAEALCSTESESARRAGSLGLGAAGDRAVPTLLRVLQTDDLPPLVAGSAVEALGDAAMGPDLAVVDTLQAICLAQAEAIAAAEEAAQARGEAGEELLPEFEAGGMVSHVNDMLQVPIMLPIACRPVAARYLCIALAQIALGRVAQTWQAHAGGGEDLAQHRAAVLEALRPWAHDPCPRVRKENGRALFLLCVAAEAGRAGGAELAALREAVAAGEKDGRKLPGADQANAALERAVS